MGVKLIFFIFFSFCCIIFRTSLNAIFLITVFCAQSLTVHIEDPGIDMLDGECFVDSESPNRIWESEWQNNDWFSSSTLTIESCRAFCAARDFIYFGVQFGHMCLCGNTSPSPSLQTSESDCNMPCAGNPSQLCGATYRMNIYTINNQG